MKVCTKCKQEKPESEFSWKNKATGKLNAWCKACHAIARNAHYESNKEKIRSQIKARQRDLINKVFNYKAERSCVDCGESDAIVLEFDHISDDKSFNIGEAGRDGRSWDSILAEIEKCDIVCRNCHVRRTWARAGWTRDNFNASLV